MSARTKTLKLETDKYIIERELWDYLQTLPHGEYSRATKSYWIKEMHNDKLKRTESLPTWKMIELLKIGEIAIGADGYYEGTRLIRTDHNEIIYMDGKAGSINDFFELNTFAFSANWKIVTA